MSYLRRFYGFSPHSCWRCDRLVRPAGLYVYEPPTKERPYLHRNIRCATCAAEDFPDEWAEFFGKVLLEEKQW